MATRMLRCFLALALVGMALPASAVVVDDFSNNHAAIGDGGATSVAAAAAVGGRRGLTARLRMGSGPMSAGVAGGTLTFSVTDTTPINSRGEAVVTWDADANALVLSPTGLGGANLTASGASGFRLLFSSTTVIAEVEITVYGNGTDFSHVARRVPVSGSPQSVLIPFAEFRVAGGVGADFSSVGAIVLVLRAGEGMVNLDEISTTPPNPTAFVATKVDAQIIDVDGDTRVDPGDRVRYTVTVTNPSTSNQALDVDFTDMVDANTMLVGSTSTTPIAHNDQFGWFGNVMFATDGGPAKPHLLDNDVDLDGDTLTVQAGTFPATSAQGGTLSLVSAATGAFTYSPPSGFSGVDSFSYTVLDDDGHPSTAMAHITLDGVVWFVDDSNATPPHLGTQADPFQTLASVNSGSDPDQPGDIIFVHADDGTPYAGGLVLEAEQRLIGEGAGLTLGGTPIVLAGGTPRITNAAGVGLTLSTGNALSGFNVLNTSGAGIVGSSFGTLTTPPAPSSISVMNAGGAALDLATGDLAAVTFGTLSSTGSAGQRGVSLVTITGSLSASTTSLTNPTTDGIFVSGSAGGTFSFGTTTVTDNAIGAGPSGDGIDVATGNTGTVFNFSSVALTTDGGAGIRANNSGTLQINGATNTISATGGAAVDITSTSLGTGATFSTVTSMNNAGGKGINLDTVTGNFIANGGSISGAGNVAFDVNAGASTITYAGSITNTANRSVEVTGRTGGTVTLSGNINDTGTGINIANNNTSGTPIINLTGATKTISTGANPAVTLDNNDVANVNFTGGGLAITTMGGIGFNAINGAAGITVQGTVNTITSTTGTALNVVSSTIGAAGLTFQSISAGTGAGSSGLGISVVGSGLAAGNGGLTITGTGSAGSGGTIQHKTGADGSTTAGIGIYLQDTKNTVLSWMQLNDFDNTAIAGRNVQGFELSNSVINGVSGTSSAAIEGPIVFGLTSPAPTNGLMGTGLIRNTKISGGIEHNLEFYNQSGSMNLTIEGTVAVSEGANPNSPADDVADCIIEENSAVSGADGIQIEMTSSATAAIVIDRCLFRDNRSQAIQISALNDSVVAATIDESRTRRFDQGNEGFLLQNGGNADLTAMISNSHVNNYGGTGIFVGQVAGNASASSVLHASILNNTVNQPTAATNHGILAFLTSTVGQISQARVRIDGNTVVNNSTAGTVRGILVDTPDASTTPAFHATVTNNSVAVGDNVGGVAGLVVQARQASDGCANIGSNTVTFPNGTPGGVFGIRARQANTATYDLEGSGACSGTPAVVLGCRNPASTTEVLGTLTVVPAGTCLLPAVP